MTLFSTTEEFHRTTLASVPGLLGKLDYIAGLREQDGAYHHWGLTRVYGEEAAQRAIREAHRLIFLAVLRTPLRDLIRDLAVSNGAREEGLREFVEDLSRRSRELVPAELGGGSLRHFNSVVAALLSMVRNSRRSRLAGA